ncbi:MAG: DUF924 family protein [Synechococcales bacterium]|nr:DUF924 family protein [Synechococcales bacterium]
MGQVDDILTFWFGNPVTDDTRYQARRKVWFRKSPEVDQAVCDRFQSVYEAASRGDLDHWRRTPQGSLALVLVLDQFPRHLFRDEPRAFATDAEALLVAKEAIAQGFDEALPPLQRMFFYFPLEHCEDAIAQQQSVALFRQLVAQQPELADALDYALRHQAVIDQFGRFPHRNAILGRVSTPTETEFLKQPGSSF